MTIRHLDKLSLTREQEMELREDLKVPILVTLADIQRMNTWPKLPRVHMFDLERDSGGVYVMRKEIDHNQFWRRGTPSQSGRWVNIQYPEGGTPTIFCHPLDPLFIGRLRPSFSGDSHWVRVGTLICANLDPPE